MAERPPTSPDLERALLDLGAHLPYPPTPDLASAVQRRLRDAALRETPSAPWWRGLSGGWGRRAVLVGIACLLVAAALLLLSPGARAAVSSWLRLRGVVIVFAPAAPTPPPAPVGTSLDLGQRLSIVAAQRRVSYHIELPTLAGLNTPDEVYLGDPIGAQVALVYRARTGLPRASSTRVGALLTEFPAGIEPAFLKKIAFMGTVVKPVTVHGAPGYWLSGSPHMFGYTTAPGNAYSETLRLAGNTLLWEHNGLTFRLEAAIGEAQALRIAESVR